MGELEFLLAVVVFESVADCDDARLLLESAFPDQRRAERPAVRFDRNDLVVSPNTDAVRGRLVAGLGSGILAFHAADPETAVAWAGGWWSLIVGEKSRWVRVVPAASYQWPLASREAIASRVWGRNLVVLQFEGDPNGTRSRTGDVRFEGEPVGSPDLFLSPLLGVTADANLIRRVAASTELSGRAVVLPPRPLWRAPDSDVMCPANHPALEWAREQLVERFERAFANEPSEAPGFVEVLRVLTEPLVWDLVGLGGELWFTDLVGEAEVPGRPPPPLELRLPEVPEPLRVLADFCCTDPGADEPGPENWRAALRRACAGPALALADQWRVRFSRGPARGGERFSLDVPLEPFADRVFAYWRVAEHRAGKVWLPAARGETLAQCRASWQEHGQHSWELIGRTLEGADDARSDTLALLAGSLHQGTQAGRLDTFLAVALFWPVLRPFVGIDPPLWNELAWPEFFRAVARLLTEDAPGREEVMGAAESYLLAASAMPRGDHLAWEWVRHDPPEEDASVVFPPIERWLRLVPCIRLLIPLGVRMRPGVWLADDPPAVPTELQWLAACPGYGYIADVPNDPAGDGARG